MKKYLLLFVLFLSTGTPCFALKEYFAISRSIRALGMGGAFYGLSDDEYALFYNPAGLSVYRGNGQGMLSVNTHVSKGLFSGVQHLSTGNAEKIDAIVNKILDYQGKPFHVTAGVFPYYMRKHFAIGLLIAEPKVDVALLGRDFNSSVDLSAVSDSGLLVGYANSFVDDSLHIGVNLKGIYRAGGKKIFTLSELAKKEAVKIDPKELGGAGGGVDFDLGGTYELPELPFGILSRTSLVFNNLLASRMTIARMGGDPPGLPRTMSLGWYTVFPGMSWIDNFHLLVDFAEFRLGGEENPEVGARTGSFFKHVNLGLEIPLNGWFVPRFGVHQGYFTAGVGINLRVFRFEFATYEEELSSTPGRLGNRRFALRVQIGGGAASPDPIISRGKPEQGPSEAPAVEEKPAPVESAPAAKPEAAQETKPETAPETGKEAKSPEAGTEPKPETTTPAPLPDARAPQGEKPAPLMEPGPEAAPDASSVKPDGERVPQSEPVDRYQVAPEEPVSSVPPSANEVLPKSEGTSVDRFGIDKMMQETPGNP